MATYSFLAKYLGIIWRAAVLTRDILIAPASNNFHRLKLYARLSSNFYQINPNFIHYAIQYVIVFGNVNKFFESQMDSGYKIQTNASKVLLKLCIEDLLCSLAISLWHLVTTEPSFTSMAIINSTWTSMGCSLMIPTLDDGVLFFGGRFDELFPFLEAGCSSKIRPLSPS